MVVASDRALHLWRRTMCLVVAFDVVVAALKSHFRPGFDPSSQPALGALTTPALAVLCLGALAGLFVYSRPGARWLFGAGAFVAVRAVFAIYEATYPAGHEDFVQGGAAYLGWLFGHGLALRARAPAERGLSSGATERLAATGFLAALATTYLTAGLSKLVESGGAWMSTDALRLMVVSHYEHGMGGPLDGLRAWLGESPALCGALALGTLVIQLGAFALVGSPRLRTLWAGLLILLHAGIWVASRILFVQVLVLLVAVVVPWGERGKRAASSNAAPLDAARRALDAERLGRAVLAFLAAAGLVVALGRALAIGQP